MKLPDMICLAVIIFVSGFFFGVGLGDHRAKEIAVKNNCGHYDLKTGEFQWGAYK